MTIQNYIRKELSQSLAADAGNGNFNKYLYCKEKGKEKFMKFSMYKRETEDNNYRENSCRAVNLKPAENAPLSCEKSEGCGRHTIFKKLRPEFVRKSPAVSI